MLGFYAKCSALLLSFLLAAGNAAADQVQISNLSDVSVPEWITGDANIVQNVLVCIYRQDTTGNDRMYGIQINGSGSGGAFTLANGSTTLPYSVTWNDGGASNPAGGTTSPVYSNIELTNQDNASNNNDTPSSTTCNGGAAPTAQLQLTITSANMDSVPDGTYSGTITLILSLT